MSETTKPSGRIWPTKLEQWQTYCNLRGDSIRVVGRVTGRVRAVLDLNADICGKEVYFADDSEWYLENGRRLIRRPSGPIEQAYCIDPDVTHDLFPSAAVAMMERRRLIVNGVVDGQGNRLVPPSDAPKPKTLDDYARMLSQG